MMEISDRHWGILRVAGHAGFVQRMIEKYLPEHHRIIASREADELYREYLVEGPDMPFVRGQNMPEQVALLFLVDDDGNYCYWEHQAHKRWRVDAATH